MDVCRATTFGHYDWTTTYRNTWANSTTPTSKYNTLSTICQQTRKVQGLASVCLLVDINSSYLKMLNIHGNVRYVYARCVDVVNIPSSLENHMEKFCALKTVSRAISLATEDVMTNWILLTNETKVSTFIKQNVDIT